MSETIDLGAGHTLRFLRWAPDDLPGNRERYGVSLPNVDRAGAIISHQRPDGASCESVVHFDIPEMLLAGEKVVWKVESWDPLTLSPSLLCGRCGDHGFVREGRWVKA